MKRIAIAVLSLSIAAGAGAATFKNQGYSVLVVKTTNKQPNEGEIMNGIRNPGEIKRQSSNGTLYYWLTADPKKGARLRSIPPAQELNGVTESDVFICKDKCVKQ